MTTVDYEGLALAVKSAARKVESQTAHRAMDAAAHGLRLIAAELAASQAEVARSQAREEELEGIISELISKTRGLLSVLKGPK